MSSKNKNRHRRNIHKPIKVLENTTVETKVEETKIEETSFEENSNKERTDFEKASAENPIVEDKGTENNIINLNPTEILSDKDVDCIKELSEPENEPSNESNEGENINIIEKEKKLFEEIKKDIKNISTSNTREMIIASTKILLPVAALAIIIATVFTLIKTKNNNIESATTVVTNTSESSGIGTASLPEEELKENAIEEVNALFSTFYKALSDGDIETIKNLKDYNDDTELITYEKRSEFIESYDNVVCYTKSGLEPNSYFVYVSYEAKVNGVETKAPGLYPWYVYTAEDGSLKIDGDMDEQITAALKLVTNQDDVVDLYNKVDVKYKEAIASDENLNTFLTELPTQIKVSVGEALAMMETQENSTEEGVADTGNSGEETVEEAPQTDESNKPQNQTVNEKVKATETVNVRSSDSEEADKLGKAQAGMELTRTEIKVNGWSKVIFEGKEAYIKSDYLEVISSAETSSTTDSANTTNTTTKTSGKVRATTNVNVRNSPKQDADAIGVAQGGSDYTLIDNMGEWLKIDYNGHEGFVKSEFFQ